MTVTLLLVVALMHIFTATANTWQHGEAQVDAYREARGALQIMERDLSATIQAASIPVPTPTPGAGGASTSTLGPVLPVLELQHYSTADTSGPVNEEVYCLTNLPASGSSSLSAVGYYLQWMPDLNTNTSAAARAPRAYALMRESIDSDSTFLRFQRATQAAGNNVTPLSFMEVYGRTSADNPIGVVHVDQLAAYVWDLRFRIDTDLNETTYPDGDAMGVPKDHSGNLYYQGDGQSSPYPAYLPAYVEVRFRALSATAGRRLEGNQGVTQQTWNDTAGNTPANLPLYQSVIQPNAQQFILRVPLLNATPQATPSVSPTP